MTLKKLVTKYLSEDVRVLGYTRPQTISILRKLWSKSTAEKAYNKLAHPEASDFYSISSRFLNEVYLKAPEASLDDVIKCVEELWEHNIVE